MSESKLIFTYSVRLVVREWRRFVLPCISLAITAMVLTVVLLLSSASSFYLQKQAKEILGGDIVVESTAPVEIETLWEGAGIYPESQSNQLSFNGTLGAGGETAPFSIKVVDSAYPLYGEVILTGGEFASIEDSVIFLDVAGAERLKVSIGDSISFGEKEFSLGGIISSEPTSLLAGFRFLPQALISEAGFASTDVPPSLLRAEYVYAVKVPDLSSQSIKKLQEAETFSNGFIDIDIAGENRTGLERSIQIIADFLIVAVLITCVLAAVNVYASTLYLVTVERKSLAVLLALGLTRNRLMAVLGAALGYVVIIASAIGVLAGVLIFYFLNTLLTNVYSITLPTPNIPAYALICASIIATIAISSFVPAVRRTLSLSPRETLIGVSNDAGESFGIRSLFLITGSALIPLAAIAAFLLDSFAYGILLVSAITTIYISTALLFTGGLYFLYRKRSRFSFFFRSIISQKKADGLFGVVSFTSLLVALTALSTLTLLQSSLNRYLTGDLAQTVPTTYILDVQPSQQEKVVSAFPEVELFSSIPARIIAIDDTRIQDELQRPESKIDRELGREFNLTARDTLLSSENISQGVWSNGVSGEISVDEDFAKRSNIRLGSTLIFIIQGFEVSGIVTSLRTTDSRSGLPFFYFVLSPEDVKEFPGVYFGYSYYDENKQKELSRFLAVNAPNVSVLETQTIGALVLKIVSILAVFVLIVTLPPLLIATLLIATLVVSSYSARKREGARLRAVGASKRFVLVQYIVETISLTLLASIFAYMLSVLATFLISQYYFQLDTATMFDLELISSLGLIILLVALIGLYLFKTDTMPLRELLSYGEN